VNAADEPLDPQVAELLSAGLDGDLSPDERSAADAWVERSAAARAERDALLGVKAALAALPGVEPPPGFLEAMLEHGSPRPAVVVVARRQHRWGRSPAALAVSALATAAAWVVVAGAAAEPVQPPVDGVQAAALDVAGLRSADADDAPIQRAGRLELVEAMHHDDEVLAVLGDRGGTRVAVLRQEGPVDWADLPDGDRGRLAGATTWVDLTSDPGVARVVVARDGAVYTLVSADMAADVLLDLGADLPAGDGVDHGLGARARRACESLVEALSLG
jgi:hypothetical protein